MKRAAAIALFALVSAGCFGGSKNEKVIPWIPDRPTVGHVITRHLARPCRTSDFRASLSFQGATGSLVGGISLEHVGNDSCSLLGQPRVRFIGPAARRERWIISWMKSFPRDPDLVYPPQSTLRGIRPNEQVSVQMIWRNWCGPTSKPASGPGPPPNALVLTLPRKGGEIRLTTDPPRVAPRCDVPGASSLRMSSFLPTEREPPASSHIPLVASIVGSRPGGKEVRLHLSAGRPYRYQVALTNNSKRPFRFKSCPTYLEGLSSVFRGERHVLNCKPVGGIAPGERVVFEMVFHVPADAPIENNGLSWELGQKTAQPSPFADAAVRLSR
jgi:hypothetical protein